jgi:hypothetical protein
MVIIVARQEAVTAMPRRIKWSGIDEQKIRDEYPTKGPTALAGEMGLKVSTLIAKARKMGVKHTEHRLVRPERNTDESECQYLRRLVRANILKVKRGDKVCWEWQAGKAVGYGHVVINGALWLAHRLSWWAYTEGHPPADKNVCHECDNPCCCNPTHLFIGDDKDNAQDKVNKGRQAAGEDHGCAKLTEERVRSIRQRYQAKRGQLKQIAEEEQMSVDTIRKIVRGDLWMKGVSEVDWNDQPITEKRKVLPAGPIEGTELTVIGPGPMRGVNSTTVVRCSCGTEKVILNFNLTSGKTLSCGCVGRQRASERVRANPPRLGTGNNPNPSTRGNQ